MTTIVMTKEGPVPTDPSVLRADLVARVELTNPGYSANLPAALVEDIASTDVGALIVCDSAKVDLINSLTPFGANEFLLREQGALVGVLPGQTTNTSVYVVFTGTPGFVIVRGFTVGDGTHQYIVQDGGEIPSGGVSDPLYCLATIAGTWAVPNDTVTQYVTAVPTSFSLTFTNPLDGLPSAGDESIAVYRANVIRPYGTGSSQGMATYLKTLLSKIAGVQTRLIAVQQGSPGWKVIVGGGDPYDVANAIYTALFDISTLVGSADPGLNITVDLYDYPDTYSVIFVVPFQQTVSISLTWDTIAPNFVSSAAVAQLGAPALAAYVNSVAAGQPMNLFELQNAFQLAVVDIIPTPLLTRMVFVVSIDGTPTPPDSGTGKIVGDPEGYFFTDINSITIARG